MHTNLISGKWYGFILMIGILAGLTGCNEKEDHSLKIVDHEENRICLYYPGSNQGCITIDGGVRPYTVSCDSEILHVYMDQWPNAFNYEVQGIGEAQVKVSDASGQSLLLDVVIQYREEYFEVTKRDVYVKGEGITVEDQEELEEKALATIPVQEGGKYQFIYTGLESGIVYIYQERFTATRIEGTFVTESVTADDNEWRRYIVYTINFQEEEHRFSPYRYSPGTRSDMLVPIALYEDLLGKYQTAYPGLEAVYTMQVIQ